MLPAIPATRPGLGRIASPDDRDRLFPMTAVMRQPQRVYQRRRWKVGPLLDQGQTGTCVGHGWRNWLNCTPVPTKPDVGPAPFDIYDHAILLDEWPSNDRDPQRQMGTSVRAGCDYLRQLGRIKSYVWGFDADTVARYVLTTSPVVLGTSWYDGMFTPDAEGIVRATGSVAGGHCYLLHGIDQPRGMAECFNSWGKWGYKNGGHFFMDLETLDRLIKEQGEAADALERRLVVAQPPAPLPVAGVL